MAEIKYLGELEEDSGIKYLGSFDEEKRKEESQYSLTNPLEALKNIVSNIPKSGAGFVGGIASAVRHPWETTKAVGKTALGLGEKIIPGEQEHEKYFNALADFYSKRYGGLENFSKTVQQDPVGFLADLSTVLAGTGVALKGAGAISKVSPITKAGQTVSKIGGIVDPLNLASHPLKFVARGIGKVGSSIVGEATTGAGKYAIEEAYKGGKGFTEGLRGRIEPETIIGQAKGALNQVKADRLSEYTSKLDDISQITQQLDATPIKNRLVNYLKSYNVNRTNKGLDFSRSTLNNNARKDVSEIVRTIDDWGSRADDFTPKGLDILKRRLDDFYSESKNSRAMVAGLRNEVKKVLVENVPQYYEMTKGYADTTNMITEMEKALSLGKRSSIDTATRKLAGAMRENQTFKNSLISKLDELGGSDLLSQLAGVSMSTYVPQGLVGRLGAIGEIAGLITTFDPIFAAALISSSPKIAGELINALGKSIRTYQKTRQYIPKGIGKYGFQAGRIKELEENQLMPELADLLKGQ